MQIKNLKVSQLFRDINVYYFTEKNLIGINV